MMSLVAVIKNLTHLVSAIDVGVKLYKVITKKKETQKETDVK